MVVKLIFERIVWCCYSCVCGRSDDLYGYIGDGEVRVLVESIGWVRLVNYVSKYI